MARGVTGDAAKLEMAMATLRHLCGELQVSRPSIYRWQRKAGFPLPYKFGRASRWDMREVAAWVAARRRSGTTPSDK